MMTIDRFPDLPFVSLFVSVSVSLSIVVSASVFVSVKSDAPKRLLLLRIARVTRALPPGLSLPAAADCA